MQSLFSGTILIIVGVRDTSAGTATVQVVISVVDINDNRPIFRRLPTSVEIPEVRC